MKLSGKVVLSVILVVTGLLIYVYTIDPARVEHQYSTGFFPVFSSLLRSFSGLFSFSLGDIIYALLSIWLLWKLIRFIRIKVNRGSRLLKLFSLLAVIYVLFNLFWGINYGRQGIAFQLGLKTDEYTIEELKDLNCALIDKVNATRKELGERTTYPSPSKILPEVRSAFNEAALIYPFLSLKNTALKPSLWSRLGDYIGFTGYYNPFTAEAQVNVNVPPFIIPFTACHEVAHQIGYAKEMEANFVGYLVAGNSSDKFFRYSAYFDLFLYANRSLRQTDSVTAKIYRNDLDPLVKGDLKEWKEYNLKYNSPLSPVVWWFYGKFLQSNQQPQGILSYDEVTSFLIAYKKKFGKI